LLLFFWSNPLMGILRIEGGRLLLPCCLALLPSSLLFWILGGALSFAPNHHEFTGIEGC